MRSRRRSSAWAEAAAAPQGAVDPFCELTVLHNYLKPFEAMPALHSVPGPGQTGNHCSQFPIPATMPPGRYRMVKEFRYRAVSIGGPETPEVIATPEFEILP